MALEGHLADDPVGDPRVVLLGEVDLGPVHAVDIARLLSMPRVLVPASPGVFTAMGMLAGDVVRC